MEGLVGGLCRVLFLIEETLEACELLAHISVDLQVSCDNNFHLLYIVINVTIFRILALDILN